MASNQGHRWLSSSQALGSHSVPIEPWMTISRMDQNNQDRPTENTKPAILSNGFSAVMSTIFSSNLPSRCTPTATVMNVTAKAKMPR